MPEDCVIFHDEGNSFYPKGENLIQSLGFPNERSFPPAVHQWLSPNDNNLHGVAKAKWYKNPDFRKDKVTASLSLMHFLDLDTEEHSKYYFKRNILNLTKTSAYDVIKR